MEAFVVIKLDFEYASALKYKRIPPEPKYYDEKYLGIIHKIDVIKKYWEKEDINILKEEWWLK